MRLIPLTPAFVKNALQQMKRGPKPKKAEPKSTRYSSIA